MILWQEATTKASESHVVDTVMNWADKFGWPALILVIGSLVLWRVAMKATSFAKPYVVRFMDAQLELIETVRVSSERSAEATERVSENVTDLHKRHDKHDLKLDAIHDAVKK